MQVKPKIHIHFLYLKLMAAFSLLIILLLTTALFGNQREQDIIRDTLMDSLHSKVNFYAATLTSEVTNLQQDTYAYINDSDFVKLSVLYNDLSDYQKTESILEVRKKLLLLRSTTPYANNLFIYLPAMARSINALNFDYELSTDDVEAMMTSRSYEKLVLPYNGKLFVRSFFPAFWTQGTLPRAIIAVELSNSKIASMLADMEGIGGGGALLVGPDWHIAAPGRATSEDTEQIIGEARVLALSVENPIHSWQSGGRLLVGQYIEVMDAVLLIHLPQSQVLAPLLAAQKWIIGLALLALAIVVVAALAIYKMVHVPMHRLVGAFRQVEGGDRSVRLPSSSKDEFGYLYRRFNQMMDTLDELIKQVYEQRILSQQSQLKQLQTQINPHFFFNSFFILRGLIDMGDNETASQMLKHLGDYFQYITRSGRDTIPFSEEMGHAMAYCEVQKLRFEHIDLRVQPLPEELADIKVPRLILQPLLENAYKYGFESKIEEGFIDISFDCDGSHYFITVRDSGKPIDPNELKAMRQKLDERTDISLETTAIINIHRRLRLYFGQAGGLDIQANDSVGTCIIIKIPIKTQEAC